MSDSDEIFIPPTPSDKKLKKSKIPKKLCVCNTFTHTKFLKTFWQSVSVLPERKKPYVYYSLKEILSFTQTFAPVNNKIRTVGIYQQKDTQLQFLISSSLRLTKVLLDFKLTEKLPLISQQIQVFGFLDFKLLEKSDAYVPILIVHFWNAIEGNIEEFTAQLQLLQRPLAVITGSRSVEDTDSTFFENTTNIESYFDEINDTVFNQAAEAAEVVCKEFSERLNVSDDLFE